MERRAEEQKAGLVSGFSVIDGHIQCNATMQIIEDAPIEALDLNRKVYNALYRLRGNISFASHDKIMISDVLLLTYKQLMLAPNLGIKAAEEINCKVSSYLETAKIGTAEMRPRGVDIAPDYKVEDGLITHIESGRVVPDVSIACIGLRDGIVNSLLSNEISTLSELLMRTRRQVRSFPRIGAGAVNEILSVAQVYLKTHQGSPTTSFVETSDVGMMAPNYSVVDSGIYNRETKKIIRDAPIELLGLSARASNKISRSGIKKISDLIRLSFKTVSKIKGIGPLTAKEIQEGLGQYLKCELEYSQVVVNEFALREEVLRIFYARQFEAFSTNDLKVFLIGANEKELAGLLESLVEEKFLIKEGKDYHLPCKPFSSFVESLCPESDKGMDTRAFSMLRERMSGNSLEQIGKAYGLTRERVRQLVAKANRQIIRKGRYCFREDTYAYLFCTYKVEKRFFFDVLGVDACGWYYLTVKYKKGTANMKTAVHDMALSEQLRQAIEQYI